MKNFREAIPIFLIMLILSIPSTLSIYGGETISYNFPNCFLLTANITNATLDEWKLAPNCNEDNAGNFTCLCSDNYQLNLTPKANSIGTFGILMTDYYSISTATTTLSSNSYVWTTCKPEYYVCSNFQKCCSNLDCKNNICIPVSTPIIITPSTLSSSTSTSISISIPQPQTSNLLLLATIIIIVGIAGLIAWRLKKSKKVNTWSAQEL